MLMEKTGLHAEEGRVGRAPQLEIDVAGLSNNSVLLAMALACFLAKVEAPTICLAIVLAVGIVIGMMIGPRCRARRADDVEEIETAKHDVKAEHVGLNPEEAQTEETKRSSKTASLSAKSSRRTDAAAAIVLTTKFGGCYHAEDCECIRGSRHPVTRWRPCSKCLG